MFTDDQIDVYRQYVGKISNMNVPIRSVSWEVTDSIPIADANWIR